MVELPQGHLGANILAHGEQCDSKYGKCLERIVFLDVCFGLFGIFTLLPLLLRLLRRVDMFITVVEHGLHLQYVAGTSERAHFNQDLCRLRDGIINRFKSFDGGIRRVLQACVLRDLGQRTWQPRVDEGEPTQV
jgi:hypothetical protein